MNRYLFTFCLLAFSTQLLAQQSNSLFVKKDTFDYRGTLSKFINGYKPINKADSGFVEAYQYLDHFFTSDSVQDSFNKVLNVVNSNVIDSMLLSFDNFVSKVDSLNSVRERVLSDYWERLRLQQMADTGEISSEDSLFVEAMDAVLYQDSINIDSVLSELESFNDTLILALQTSINEYRSHQIANWIRNFRNDTVLMYLVNIEGDSLPIRLYNDNPSLIRFGLTDYWGSTIPAVIRNVEKRSFKIYIDDGPETNYIEDDQAKEALKGIMKKTSVRTLTLKPKEIVIPKPVWSLKGRANIDVTQVGMYQWAQGGDPSMSVRAGVELSAKYRKGKQNWDNTGKFEYGVIRQGMYRDTTVHFRSNKDRMEIASKYGYKVFGKNYLTFEGDFKSQFAPTFVWQGNEKTDEIYSEFMSPGYLTFSLGLDYKPDDNTTVFAAPITNKSTYVLLNDANIRSRYGVDTTKNARHEFGARIKINHKKKVWDNIEIKNSIELFSSYLHNPQNIDVNWELAIILPVNDYIRASITMNLIYDDDTKVPTHDIDDDGTTYGVQFREMIAVGFTARF